MANERTTFVFNLEWVEYFEDFDSEGRLHFFDAIVAYAQHGEKPSNLTTAEMGIFKAIMKDIDRNNARFEEIKQKRAEAGRRGGQRSGIVRSKTKQTKQMLNLLNKTKQTKQDEANEAEYENENEYEDENVTLNSVCENNNAHTREEGSNLEQEAREFIQFYNETVAGTDIPQARITEGRIIRTGKILHKIGKEEMKEAIQKAASSILALGKFGTGYDWFCDEDNIIKVIEGTYDKRNDTSGVGFRGQEARHLEQLRELAGGDAERYALLEATYRNRG